jgi:hypothetical protein
MDSITRLAARAGLVLLLAATLMATGLRQPAVSAQQETSSSPAAEEPPFHLAYDGVLDVPHLPSLARAVGAAPALAAPQYADWSRLVFQSARNGHDWEVYGARGDGSDQINLSNRSSMEMHPRLNRGATRVAFASDRTDDYEIFAMNADGSDQDRLTKNEADDVYPAWSRDGSRIAFQSYRDGQPEIYVMNADGAGATRLTVHDDYDGMPAWSPDGSKIAFTRRSSDLYRIWVMNADGSNPQQLAGQPYSENPAWSPDGSQIAYDADGDGDGWQEIWLMDATGGNQRQVYKPPASQTDAYVRSWSPDGRYVAFTQVSYVEYGGQWYWTAAYLQAWDSANPGNTISLGPGDEEWYPDWQTTDLQAPESAVEPLPAQSPATFMVTWGGTDTGGAGIRNYDVAVKDGPGGAWTDWQTGTAGNQASYTGIGGHTYYFQVRARDNAANVEAWLADYDASTSVESMPPVTAVLPLPRLVRGTNLLVSWSGSDPGGSGIESYDVQHRQGDGDWTDWQMGTTDTSASFSGSAGEEYGFRVRARDKALNLEAWPAAGADAVTTFYTWAIGGQATDNRGAPVAGMAVTTTPAAFLSAPSDGDGAYAAYVAGQAAAYTVSWSKAAYEALPDTAFPSAPDAEADVVMPPVDNTVQNWGFENGSSSWQFGGDLTGTITDTEKHSGASAAFLGSEGGPLSSITALLDPPEQGRYPNQDSAIDATGVVHTVWLGPGTGGLLYSNKAPAAPWTSPVPVPGTAGSWISGHRLRADDAGTVHVIWTTWPTPRILYYSRKQPGVGWSVPEQVVESYHGGALDLELTPSGGVKAMWGTTLSQRDPSGNWTSSQLDLSPYVYGAELQMATGPSGLAHVLWITYDGATGHLSAYYTAETETGSWLPAVKLSQHDSNVQSADMVIDVLGAVHVVTAADGVHYHTRSSGGTWAPVEVVAASMSGGASLAVDDQDRIHVAWSDTTSYQMLYASRSEAGWTNPVGVASASVSSVWTAPRIAVGTNRTAHLLWLDRHDHGAGALYGVRYATQDGQGRWGPLVDVYHGNEGLPRGLQLLLDSLGASHALWSAPVEGNWWPVFYAGSEPVQAAGESTLSQVVQVPAAETAPTLSFQYQFGTAFPSESRLEVVVDDAISPSTVFSTTMAVNAWDHQWVDLTPWAGRSVTLRFKVSEVAGGARAWAYIDEVTVGSAHPDVWVSLSGPRSAPPGQQVVQSITYGNRGGVAAGSAQVTLQLPPELSFAGADPPPSALTPVLRWDVGDLAAGGGPGTIHVTLQVATDAVTGTTVTATAAIASGTAEIEQDNNTAHAPTFIGYLIYLPVVRRQ